MFFKRRSSLLKLWDRDEVLSRARDCYSFAVRYKEFPKPGQFEPELEAEWVGGSAALCCSDAVRKLSDRDFLLIASAHFLFRSIGAWVLGKPLESQLADSGLNQGQLVLKAAETVE